MTKLLIFTPSGTVAVSTGQFQYVSVVLDLSHFLWRMLMDSFPATRLWLQMKQCQRQRSMVCKRHTLLRRRRWIAEGVGSEVNSRVQPSPSISRPCTARVCLLPSNLFQTYRGDRCGTLRVGLNFLPFQHLLKIAQRRIVFLCQLCF